MSLSSLYFIWLCDGGRVERCWKLSVYRGLVSRLRFRILACEARVGRETLSSMADYPVYNSVSLFVSSHHVSAMGVLAARRRPGLGSPSRAKASFGRSFESIGLRSARILGTEALELLIMSTLQPAVLRLQFACWLLVVASLQPASLMSVENASLKRSSEISYSSDDTRRTGIRGNEVILTLQVVIIVG
ncbi:hypothetical protein F2Q68_00043470 [Brassica cretica]|uniref:Uncharacterized protein n=1 Tax=Brassica cretica TaxID=69181 RepID=A0A8S9LPG7_BRACR|nr:hypothetical protein F2Q68_00043470 [Brassica cretica]